jgi:hypothetical protein
MRLLTFVLLTACGTPMLSPDSGVPDSGGPMVDAGAMMDAGAMDSGVPDAGWVEADHPAQPLVLSKGGPVVQHPKLVPVTFPNDPIASDIEAMIAALAGTDAYKNELVEWGAGKPLPQPPIRDSQVIGSTFDDTQIQALLTDRLAPDAGSGWPAADMDTVYLLFFPPGSTITSYGATSCVDFHGYHASTAVGGAKIIYAVISRCDSIPEVPGLSPVDYAAAVMSHEMMEAVTDPLPFAHPAYNAEDADHMVWRLAVEGELGDMCALVGDAFYTPPDFPHPVQRLWSNLAALSGHDPCIPQPIMGEPYFNSVPELDDDITLSQQPGIVLHTKGVKIPVGGTKDIELDLFSDGPTSEPWSVAVREDGATPHLKLTLDRQTGQNGDKLKLTIQVDSVNPAFDGEVFVVISSLGTRKNLFFGAVGN